MIISFASIIALNSAAVVASADCSFVVAAFVSTITTTPAVVCCFLSQLACETPHIPFSAC